MPFAFPSESAFTFAGILTNDPTEARVTHSQTASEWVKIVRMREGSQAHEYLLLQLAIPGQPIRNVGVVLVECGRRLLWMWRTDWDALAPPEDSQMLRQLTADVQVWAQEMDAEAFLLMLDQASNVLRIGERDVISDSDAQAALRRIFFEKCSSEGNC